VFGLRRFSSPPDGGLFFIFARAKEEIVSQTYHFKVLYEKGLDGNYRAWVPALPACRASGHSMAEAKARVQEAIHCYCLNMLESGADIPQTPPGLPTVVDELQIHFTTA
jgi:predicted RNase H-like HicB family nuclease